MWPQQNSWPHRQFFSFFFVSSLANQYQIIWVTQSNRTLSWFGVLQESNVSYQWNSDGLYYFIFCKYEEETKTRVNNSITFFSWISFICHFLFASPFSLYDYESDLKFENKAIKIDGIAPFSRTSENFVYFCFF